MRIRYKKWARPELEASKFYEDEPEKWKGKWKEHYRNQENPFMLELGCGKGNFISQLAVENQNINYLAIDLVDAMLGLAKRNIEKAYEEKNKALDNVKLMPQEIALIDTILDSNDKIERIYINFCNPWPKDRHKKRRLTHTRQLTKYRDFLVDGGEIHFKTDDDELFEESLEYFKECNFEITYITRDLHNSGYEYNVVTEHEEMFSKQGIKIKFLIAKKL